MKHTIKLLTLAFTLAAILTLTGCPGPVNTIEPPVWDDGVVTTEPTCTTEGVKTYTCSNGETRTETIPALGHDMGDKWEITKNPTCTEKGSKTRKCSHCGETETVEIDALGHDWVLENENDDTHKCTNCETTARHTFIAGGCDKCGAYEHNKEDDYQISLSIYSSEEDPEPIKTLYFSFEKDSLSSYSEIEIDDYGIWIKLSSLLQMKPDYYKCEVKKFKGNSENWNVYEDNGNISDICWQGLNELCDLNYKIIITNK